MCCISMIASVIIVVFASIWVILSAVSRISRVRLGILGHRMFGFLSVRILSILFGCILFCSLVLCGIGRIRTFLVSLAYSSYCEE